MAYTAVATATGPTAPEGWQPQLPTPEYMASLTPEETQAIAALRELDADACRTFNDAMLLCFLHHKKLEPERAVIILRRYRDVCIQYQTHLASPVEGLRMITQGFSVWTPGARDRQGRGIIYLRPRLFGAIKEAGMTMTDMLQANLMWTFSTLADHVDNQRRGLLYVEDFTGSSLTNFPAGMGEMKKVMDAMQNAVPMRLAGVLILNPPWFLSILMTLVRPLLSRKLKERVHVLKSREELLQYIDEDNLWDEYGGRLHFDADAQRSHLNRYAVEFSRQQRIAADTGALTVEPQAVDTSDLPPIVTRPTAGSPSEDVAAAAGGSTATTVAVA